MAYETPVVRLLGTTGVIGEDGTFTISNTVDAVVAGELLVLVAGLTDSATSLAVTLTGVTDNDSNTWQTPENAMALTDYVPNAALAFAYNANAQAQSALTVTGTLGNSANNKVSAALLAVSGVLSASNPIDLPILEGVGTGDIFTVTNGSGTLEQEVSVAIKVATGWFGMPDYTSGWNPLHRVQNGSGVGLIGLLVESLVLNSNAAITGRADHPQANTAGVSMLVAVFKAKSTGNVRVRIAADSGALVTGEKPFDVRLWRNGLPEQTQAVLVEVADVSSAGVILINASSLPSFTGLSTSDVMYAWVQGLTKDTSIIPCTVETY
jgi:hypothetical protein